MTNKEKEYLRLYGNVPNNFFDRFLHLIKELNIGKKELRLIRERIIYFFESNKWERLNFTFYFLPEGAPRPRLSGKTQKFYVKGAKNDFIFFQNYIKEKDYKIITTPCTFLCDIYVPIPSGMNRTESILSELQLIRPINSPDWDNVGKKYCDMMQKSLILNDSLVVDGRVRKFYSSKPRIEVEIKYLEDYDSKFNKKRIESWKSYKEIDKK